MIIDVNGNIFYDDVFVPSTSVSLTLREMYGGFPREIFWNTTNEFQISLWDNIGSFHQLATPNHAANEIFEGFFTDPCDILCEMEYEFHGNVAITTQRPIDPNIELSSIESGCDLAMFTGVTMFPTKHVKDMPLYDVILTMFSNGECVICLQEDVRVCLCKLCNIQACYECVCESQRIYSFDFDEEETYVYKCHQCERARAL